MQSSEQLNELAGALCAAQAELKNPSLNASVKVKTQQGAGYQFRYADLPSILDMARPVLAKHGLALAQLVNGDSLETLLLHKSGQWLAAKSPLNPKQAGPQAYGSEITYQRRYAVSAILGLAGDPDDDGNLSEGHQAAPSSHTGPQAAKPATPPPASKPQGATPPGQATTKGDRITEPQAKALYGLGRALGLATKDALLKALNGWLAREIPGRAAITSTGELTKAEASRIIESMKAKAPVQGDPAQPAPASDPAPAPDTKTQPMDEMPW
jgi:hypothetical protein